MPPTSSPSIAVATPHAAATKAALEIAERGGNAIDVAITAAAALTVVYPHMCNVGGDMIALVRRPDGSTECINASGSYGSGLGAEQLAEVQRSGLPITGPLTVSIPGVVAGWRELATRHGSLPVAELLAPAIQFAEEGVEVSPDLADTIAEDAAALRQDPGMSALFFPDGKPLTTGDRLTQPALASTLRQLAEAGFDDFYRGRTAETLSDGFARLGVPVTAADLAEFAPVIETALSSTVRDALIMTARPNSQGFTFLRSLGANELANVRNLDHPWALLVELLYDADSLRDAVLADPRATEIDVDRYISAAGVADALSGAEAVLAGEPRGSRRVTPRPGGDTVAVTVTCSDGTAVSLIQSVFHAFGSQLLEPTTGAVLHNRASFFSTDATSPNFLEPGRRPAHTLMPVIIEHADGSVSAHGTMGGKAQSQIHTQLMLRAFEGLEPGEIVAAPRFIVGGLDVGSDREHILVEEELEADKIADFAATALPLVQAKLLDSNLGHSMAARVWPDGRVAAGSDPRSDGGAGVTTASATK